MSAAGISVTDRRYDSFVDQEEALPGWEQTYRQIDRGRFEGRVTTLRLGDLWISRERFNRSMENEYRLSPDRFGLWVLMRRTGVLHNAFGDFGPGRAGIIAAGESGRVFFESGADVMIVTLPAEASGPPAGRLCEGAGAAARALADWLAVILQTGACGQARPELLALAPDLIRDRLSALLDGGAAGVLTDRQSRSLFEHILSACADLPVEERTVSALSRHLGAERASLRAACRSAIGCELDAVLAGQRLSEVHRRLYRARPDEIRVSQVGLEMGFAHFGRFAGAYREMFGEKPSQTLHRRHG